jgi:hypothetical protein
VEMLGRADWQEFLEAPFAMLMLGKTGCQACEQWTEELGSWDIPDGVRIGKILLDTPGMGRFKIAHPWVSEVDVLPYNALFVDGELVKQWAGGGVTRLENRLKRFL